MGDIVRIPEQYIVVSVYGKARMLPKLLIRRIMTGELSIAECDDPEGTSQALAAICIDYLEAE